MALLRTRARTGARTCSRSGCSDTSELSRALHDVAAGGSLVDSRVVDKLVSRPPARATRELAKLTPRELEILGLIAEGAQQRRDRASSS